MAIMKTLTVNGVTYEVTSSVPVTSVTLLASAWVGEGRRYSQEVLVPGSTAKSQVNLTPTDEQIEVFYDKDLTFSTVNKGGIVMVTVIGQKPENDYTIPVNIVEVITDDEEIHGIPVATPINPDKFATKDAVKTVNGIAPDENGNVEVTVSGGNVDLTGYATEQYVQDYAQPKGNYLTEHQDISGKLDASKLPEAVNDALAQAKASGEFDGADGKDGRGIDHIEDPGDGTIEIYYTDTVDTEGIDVITLPAGSPGKDGTSVTVKSVSESTADGGSNVVTFSDGKTVTIKNGSKGSTGATGAKGDKGEQGSQGEKGEKGATGATGSKGADGYTPVKGVDYYTEADKAEFSTYIASELAKRGQLEPLFANTIEECTDTSKMYVLPDGFIYAYVQKETAGGIAYTNLVPTSTDTDGSVFNGTGYKENVRLSSSGGISGTALNGSVATGFMPYSSLGVVRMKGATWDMTSGLLYIIAYNSSKTKLFACVANAAGSGTTYKGLSVVYDAASGVTTFDFSGGSGGAEWYDAFKNAAYIRLNAMGKGADLIVTVNQEIKEAGPTISSTWDNTGRAFVPADYEDRIVEATNKATANATAISGLQQQVNGILDGSASIMASTKFDPTVYRLPILHFPWSYPWYCPLNTG